MRVRLEKCEEENKDLKREVEELDSSCEEIVQDLMEEQCLVEELEDASEDRLEERKLVEYLDFLEDTMVCTNYSEKKKSRSISEAREHKGGN